ncbi:MAG TPA: protein kinase [Actinomycetota bacterium]|nr:protein kinase [Actinomycetota bacterium]
MAIDAGQRVFGGRYEARRRVGSGGMAEVYLAHDQLLDREVAVKALNDQLARDPQFVERFRREARAAARLSHPNIVALHDYGATDDAYYIVMEFIDGRTVGELVEVQGPLPPVRVAEIATDVANALERAHRSGLVHRDVSAGNVMISTSGETKVTDFGIARVMDEHDQQTTAGAVTVFGTAAYISPEQAQGRSVDERTDIYSLGVVMFEMLTGRPPFIAENSLALASQHVLNDPPRPSTLNGSIPPQLDAIVLRALAKRPEARFQSATEMRDELGRFVSGKKVRSTLVLDEPVSPLVQTRERIANARRNFNPMPLALALLLGLLALAGVWLVADRVTAEDVPTTPTFEGRFLRDAQRQGEALNLRLSVQRSFSDEPVGMVLSQRPGPGTEIRPGDTVFLDVSKGPEPSLAERIEDGFNNAVEGARDGIDDAVDGVRDELGQTWDEVTSIWP